MLLSAHVKASLYICLNSFLNYYYIIVIADAKHTVASLHINFHR